MAKITIGENMETTQWIFGLVMIEAAPIHKYLLISRMLPVALGTLAFRQARMVTFSRHRFPRQRAMTWQAGILDRTGLEKMAIKAIVRQSTMPARQWPWHIP